MEGQPELREVRDTPTDTGGHTMETGHETKESFWEKFIPKVPTEQAHKATKGNTVGFFWDKHSEFHKTLQWMQDLNHSNQQQPKEKNGQ